MISMSYRCSCGYATSVLDAAQSHADANLYNKSHKMEISGFITGRPQAVPASKTPEAIEAKVREKAMEAEILRRARDKGLVK